MRELWQVGGGIAKYLKPGVLFCITLLVAGCAATQQPSPTTREKLIENLGPIVEIEERAKKLTGNVQKLAFLGVIKEGDGKQLKEHYDIYYVYHEAAAVYLAQGDLVTYASHVDLASKELDLLEEKLKSLTTVKPGAGEETKEPSSWLLSF